MAERQAKMRARLQRKLEARHDGLLGAGRTSESLQPELAIGSRDYHGRKAWELLCEAEPKRREAFIRVATCNEAKKTENSDALLADLEWCTQETHALCERVQKMSYHREVMVNDLICWTGITYEPCTKHPEGFDTSMAVHYVEIPTDEEWVCDLGPPTRGKTAMNPVRVGCVVVLYGPGDPDMKTHSNLRAMQILNDDVGVYGIISARRYYILEFLMDTVSQLEEKHGVPTTLQEQMDLLDPLEQLTQTACTCDEDTFGKQLQGWLERVFLLRPTEELQSILISAMFGHWDGSERGCQQYYSDLKRLPPSHCHGIARIQAAKERHVERICDGYGSAAPPVKSDDPLPKGGGGEEGGKKKLSKAQKKAAKKAAKKGDSKAEKP